ncbi:MAG TPA: MFS transporter, partial [Candidatus Cloacimonadota bacterium]|nr:MFS transporter [Candidatus Cloacimonadota bacterium]
VGLLAGLAIGSSQSNSRTMLSMLTPTDREAEFFGFYTLTGRLSSIIGPILYGWIAHRTGDIRYSILFLIIFFSTGLIVLQFVDPQKGLQEARPSTLSIQEEP